MSDLVRVLRVLEYVGDRAAVERQVKNSLHGEKSFYWNGLGQVIIRAATVGEYPELLDTVDGSLSYKIENEEEIPSGTYDATVTSIKDGVITMRVLRKEL